MSTAELLQDWAWLIAVGLSAGFVLLLVTIKRIQARNAYKRAVAAAAAGEESSSDYYTEFMQARRNFFLLVVVVVVFLGILTFLNLYYPQA
jgi:hypothetical protein